MEESRKRVNKESRTSSNKFVNKLVDYFKFYNKNLRKKHIVIFIIMLVLFALFITSFISNSNEIKELTALNKPNSNVFSTIIKEKIPSVFLVIFAGITPFVYIPLLGLGFSIMLASNIATLSGFIVVVACVGAIIQLFGMSLAVATGIHYCSLSTKSFRYSQTTSFGINDVKKQIYEIKKNKNKVDEITQKMVEKREKQEKLNVKIPYMNISISFCISTIIVIIETFITGV